MASHVCPWWFGYALISPLRRLLQDPRRVLAPHVRAGMVVLEPGAGMGHFTLDAARMVGPSGRIVAVDVQARMVAALMRRARRAGLADRIEGRVCAPDSLGVADLDGAVDLALVIHVAHEVPDRRTLFAELLRAMRPGGAMVVAEPRGHVGEAEFAATLDAAREAGFADDRRVPFGRDLAAVLHARR
jgi:ubiquinone/menaquinone biosynthesis C-methylase UbiE